ncbi:MAG: hypothetical protein KDD69_10615 [Bdellovibrionales bacterium]|nr:hypothetical protein [Bdellovibrionales bacterium]
MSLIKETYQDARTELDDALKWISAWGVRIEATRLAAYRKGIKTLEDMWLQGKIKNFENPGGIEKALNDFFEAAEIVAIHRGLRGCSQPELKHRLSRLVKGPEYATLENPRSSSNDARNAAFELFIASTVNAAGYVTDFAREPDVFTEDEARVLLIECKRPTAPCTVERNVNEAFDTLRDRFAVSDSKKPLRGLVALSIEKVINPGGFTLIADNFRQLEKRIDREFQRFFHRYRHTWLRRCDARVIGIQVAIRTPAIIRDINLPTAVSQLCSVNTTIKGDGFYWDYVHVMRRLQKGRGSLVNPSAPIVCERSVPPGTIRKLARTFAI